MKRILCAALLALLLLGLFGCGSEPEPIPGWPVTVGGVTLAHSPRRVVSLSPALTETMVMLGYGGRLVGVSEQCELPAGAAVPARCGSLLLPDTDGILALGPELVLTSAALPKQTADALSAAGVAVLTVRWADDLEGVYQNYGLLCCAFEGELTGAQRERELRFFGTAMLDDLAGSIEAATRPPDAPKSIIWLRGMPLRMATGDTIEGRWLEQLGLTNQGGPYTGWQYPPEAEPELNPELVLLDAGISEKEFAGHDYYRRTSAVKKQRIVSVDSLPFERQSPRMFFELRRAMSALFPGAVSDALPALTLEMQPPPPPAPKRWWEKLF